MSKRLLPLAVISVFLPLAMVVWGAGAAWADYDSLRAAEEGYTPNPALVPPVEKAVQETRPDINPGATTGSLSGELQAHIAGLRKLAAVKKAVLEEGDDFSFYRPETPAESVPHALEDGFTLKTLEALVYSRNAKLAAAKKRAEASLEAFSQVENLDLLLLRYSAYTASSMNGVGPMKGREPTSMNFPFPGMTALKGEVVAASFEAARLGYEGAVRDVITTARTHFWNLLFVERALKIWRETLELLGRVERVALTRYESGKAGFQEVIKIRINRTTLEEQLTTLAQRGQTLKVKIAQLAALEAEAAAVGTPADLFAELEGKWRDDMPGLSALKEAALKYRQELNAQRSSIAKMSAMIRMGEKMAVPAFDLGLSRFEDDAVLQVGSQAKRPAFAETPASSSGAGKPKKPFYASGESYLMEARRKLEGTKLGLDDAETATEALVTERWYELDSARREWALFEQSTVELSRAAFDVSLKGYESGRVSFVALLDSYNVWLTARLGWARKFCDAKIGRARLEQTVGRRLSTLDSGVMTR